MSSSYDAYNRIASGVYLGASSAVQRSNYKLRQLGVKCVVTIRSVPVSPVYKLRGIEYHWINVVDDAEEDLLSHFARAYRIIRRARQRNKRVYIHCHLGVSRSATVLVAYFMRKNRWSMAEALAYVRNRRPTVEPNHGFLQQLRLFQAFQWQFDVRNIECRRYLVRDLIRRMKRQSLKVAINNYVNKLNANTRRQIISSLQEKGKQRACRRKKFVCAVCKKRLFDSTNVLKKTRRIVFVEPRRWMGKRFRISRWKLIRCKKCRRRVGAFWMPGRRVGARRNCHCERCSNNLHLAFAIRTKAVVRRVTAASNYQ